MTSEITEWRSSFIEKNNKDCPLNDEDISKIIVLEDELAANHDHVSLLHDNGIVTNHEFNIFTERCFSIFLEKIVAIGGEEICRDMYDYLPWERIGFLNEKKDKLANETNNELSVLIEDAIAGVGNSMFAIDKIANDIGNITRKWHDIPNVKASKLEKVAKELSSRTFEINTRIRDDVKNVLLYVIEDKEDMVRKAEKLHCANKSTSIGKYQYSQFRSGVASNIPRRGIRKTIKSTCCAPRAICKINTDKIEDELSRLKSLVIYMTDTGESHIDFQKK